MTEYSSRSFDRGRTSKTPKSGSGFAAGITGTDVSELELSTTGDVLDESDDPTKPGPVGLVGGVAPALSALKSAFPLPLTSNHSFNTSSSNIASVLIARASPLRSLLDPRRVAISRIWTSTTPAREMAERL